VSSPLTQFQKLLCIRLQEPLPLHAKPFAEIAKDFECDEQTVLMEIAALQSAGVIRRIGPVIDYRAIGRTGTLAVAHVPDEILPQVIEAVNSLKDVSHNYLREHYYNLWFTLQGDSQRQIELVLSKFSDRFDAEFHSLPVRRTFKLDVRFDADSEGDERIFSEVGNIVETEPVKLSERQKIVLAKLQKTLPVTGNPFQGLCEPGLDEKEVIEVIAGLIDKGVIRRLAAVVDHRRLGFAANVLFACEVSEEKTAHLGRQLACFRAVSHCYERTVFPGWPYNLFAMMHAKSMGEIQRIIDSFAVSERIDSYILLPTTAELKKQPVKYTFER
jgi:DNA-binding Lrp family transcriptional regulator